MNNKLKFKRILFVVFVMLFMATPLLPAQEQNDASEKSAEPSTEGSGTVYVIREMDFTVDGRTQTFALISAGEFKEGERIIGKENLANYLTNKHQLLVNQQVLEEVRIDYRLGEKEEDGTLPVTLLIYVRDSWNIIAMPHPKYDSNEGFSLTLKARDYNFLGTISEFRADLGYSQENEENNINFSIESDIPFQAAGFIWTLNFDNFFKYTFGKPLYYQNVTGLSLDLPWHLTTVTTGFNHYLTVNEENTDENRDIYGLDERFYGAYGSSELFVSWKIPFGVEVANFGELSYTPKLSGMIHYPYASMDDPRKPLTTLHHSISFGRVDWIGNYRRGLSASASNFYSWYFDRSDAPLKIGLEADIKFFRPFSKYFGVFSRLSYRQWWHWSDRAELYIPNYSSGDLIRGVIDDHIRAHQILTFNLDLPIRLLRFWPSDWFNNQNFRFFNFEMHVSPFTDLVLFNGPYNRVKDRNDPGEAKTTFTLDDMINTAGIEFIVFPGFFRSVKGRASVGYNIKKISDNGMQLRWGFLPQWDEIFIGLDHYY